MSVLWIKEQLWGPLVKASLPYWKFPAQQSPVKFLSASCPVWQQNKFLKDIRTSVYVRVLEDDRKIPSYLCSPWAVILGQHNLSCSSWEHSHSGCLTSLFSIGESELFHCPWWGTSIHSMWFLGGSGFCVVSSLVQTGMVFLVAKGNEYGFSVAGKILLQITRLQD